MVETPNGDIGGLAHHISRRGKGGGYGIKQVYDISSYLSQLCFWLLSLPPKRFRPQKKFKFVRNKKPMLYFNVAIDESKFWKSDATSMSAYDSFFRRRPTGLISPTGVGLWLLQTRFFSTTHPLPGGGVEITPPMSAPVMEWIFRVVFFRQVVFGSF